MPVDKNRAGTQTFSMDQYRGLFHTCREPGVEKDIICRYFKTGERLITCMPRSHLHIGPSRNTLLKSDVTSRDHVVRCRGSEECGSRFVNFACKFHWR